MRHRPAFCTSTAPIRKIYRKLHMAFCLVSTSMILNSITTNCWCALSLWWLSFLWLNHATVLHNYMMRTVVAIIRQEILNHCHSVVLPRDLSYFSALDQNSDIAMRFSNPNFLKAITWEETTFSRSDLDLWHLTLNVCSTSDIVIKLCTKFDQNRTICGKVIDVLAHFCQCYVILNFDGFTQYPLTLNICCRSDVTWTDSVSK